MTQQSIGFSTHYRSVPGLPARVNASELSASLLCAKVPEAVLIPSADDCLLVLGKLLQNGNNRFHSCLPPLDSIETLVDKARFAKTVQRLGVPHPRTRIVNSIQELHEMSEDDFRGYFLKPVDSLAFSRKHGVKAMIVQDKASAIALAETVNLPILLQEYIPGPPTAHYFIDGFIDRHGSVCALFARRRLRMYPPKLSNSTFMISIPVEEIQPCRRFAENFAQGSEISRHIQCGVQVRRAGREVEDFGSQRAALVVRGVCRAMRC